LGHPEAAFLPGWQRIPSWDSLGKSGDVMIAFSLNDDVERVFILWVMGCLVFS
jgi:hypothetical protein